MKKVIIAIAVLIIFLAVGFFIGYKISSKDTGSPDSPEGLTGSQPANGGKACTQEIKTCPDGSSVARTGANCEFAPCP